MHHWEEEYILPELKTSKNPPILLNVFTYESFPIESSLYTIKYLDLVLQKYWLNFLKVSSLFLSWWRRELLTFSETTIIDDRNVNFLDIFRGLVYLFNSSSKFIFNYNIFNKWAKIRICPNMECIQLGLVNVILKRKVKDSQLCFKYHK